MILTVLKIARAFFLFIVHSTKLRRFHGNLIGTPYGVQFGINCTALDQSKLSNFVECTIMYYYRSLSTIITQKRSENDKHYNLGVTSRP